MEWQQIRKRPEDYVGANLQDYEACVRTFSWAQARALLSGLPRGGLNIAHEAIERHVLAGRGDKLALRWIGRDEKVHDFTYVELGAAANRFANVLVQCGVTKGDRVFSLLGRVPELYIAALGTLENGSVFSPLFSAFGPEPIKARMTIASAKVLVTSEAFYRRKIEPWRKTLASLEHVFLTDTSGNPPPDTTDLSDAMAQASDSFETVWTSPEDMALLHFTSGTTGRPKGAVHVHEAVVAHHITGRLALDLHPDDVFWCTADPGWVTGTSYGIISPLTNGVTMIVDQAEFDAERWYRILQDQKVTVWYTAPTAIRMLMKVGAEIAMRFDLSKLRLMASVGEPLNPEAVVWGVEAFGKPFHDNWWQTETGGIMIANFPVDGGSTGIDGSAAAGCHGRIVERLEGGSVGEITEPIVTGELALRPGWPSMFRSYLHDQERYGKCFADGWYITGDLASRDVEGYYTFVGRADDIIKTAGHMVGPFEVESALLEHPAVAEAAVIGKPDPTIGEIVKAFIALKAGNQPSEELRLELIGFARKKLGAVVAPKEIEFRTSLPRTRSGKIMRRLLRMQRNGSAGRRPVHTGACFMTARADTRRLRQPRAISVHLLRQMLSIRRFEEKCAELYMATKIRGFLHLYVGEEAVAVGVMEALRRSAVVSNLSRARARTGARRPEAAIDCGDVRQESKAVAAGAAVRCICSTQATRFYGGNAIVGGGIPVALGLALADHMRAQSRVSCCFFGDGAVAEGEFHESMNLAALWKLPVLFVCEKYPAFPNCHLTRSLTSADPSATGISGFRRRSIVMKHHRCGDGHLSTRRRRLPLGVGVSRRSFFADLAGADVPCLGLLCSSDDVPSSDRPRD